ncbi:predicted protein [Botrytis cinerea T4]|uniref:Uncharacterized protein n=1 Tax=Botryotinia fuckeliana (strain T4) TaxID=999810 RepID=G2Y6S7_BOTF4|nr:predicted protein [Botrytis cinerea T4]
MDYETNERYAGFHECIRAVISKTVSFERCIAFGYDVAIRGGANESSESSL